MHIYQHLYQLSNKCLKQSWPIINFLLDKLHEVEILIDNPIQLLHLHLSLCCPLYYILQQSNLEQDVRMVGFLWWSFTQGSCHQFNTAVHQCFQYSPVMMDISYSNIPLNSNIKIGTTITIISRLNSII